jgi:predicted phage terminase large subunit-like protein
VESKKLLKNIENALFRLLFLKAYEGCIWPGKYPTPEDIKTERQKVISNTFWQREFLLKIVPEDSQVIQQRWIQYYDDTPHQRNLKENKLWELQQYRYSFLGIDLAVSQKDSADCTAIVTVEVYGWYGNVKIYVRPYPINKRMTFPKQVDTIRATVATLKPHYQNSVVVETVAYQEVMAQVLKELDICKVHSVIPRNDKRERLALISHQIKNGNVLFPREGCEELIEQITGFGVEKHDDLADALSIVVLKIFELAQNESPFVMA